MANQALIQGAYAAAPKFSEAGDAFSSAFEGRMQQFNKATEEANAKREELFSLVDNIELDDLGNTPEMTAAIMAEAKNAQNEYFEKIKNTNPFNPELRLEANKASQKINQLQALSATHQAFIKDIQDNKDLLSKVNGQDAYKRAMDFANFSIEKDKDGNYNFKDKEGNIVTRKQLAEYQDGLLEVPVTIYNDLAATTAKLKGIPSFEAITPMLIAKINTALSDKAYGEDFLFDSLGGSSNPLDKSDVGGGMRIAKYAGKTKQEILDLAPGKTKEEKIDFLRKEVTDGYMKAFEESHRLLNPEKAVEAKTGKAQETQTGTDPNTIKGQQIYNIISNLNSNATRDYTFKFPGEPQTIPFKIQKRDTGYAIQLKGDDWKFITEEEAAGLFGQEVKKDTSQEARDIISNVLGKSSAPGRSVTLFGLGN
jgi:hypothetical protein